MRDARPPDNRPELFVVLIGHARSGKSSLAATLDSTGWQVIGFGDIIRRRTSSTGAVQSRSFLADAGQRLVDLGAPALVLDAMACVRPGKHVVVLDGVRHEAVLNEIVRLAAPASVLVVGVHTPRETLRARLARDGLSRREASELLRHRTESEIDELIERADLVVKGTDPPNFSADVIHGHLLRRSG